MRRTLTVLVASAALLVPASAASAAPPGGFSNGSCNSGEQRGPESKFARDGSGYNKKGQLLEAVNGIGCAPKTDSTAADCSDPITAATDPTCVVY